MILSLEGFRVHTLTRGRPVLGMVSYAEPSIVVMDVTLPDIDGVTVAREIRRGYSTLPIILMTGHDVDLFRDRVAGDPAVQLLQKPFDLRDLINLIHRMLSK